MPFSFGIDQSGNYGYKKAGADTVIPFKSQSDIDNAYNKGITDGRVGYYTQSQYDNAYNTGYNKGKNDRKIEHNLYFTFNGYHKVGYVGTIIDGTYNVQWIIYTISGNTCQLFPMQSLGYHVMNSTATTYGGYKGSEMYTYIHNTVLPGLKRSGLNITACDLVSKSIFEDICTKTGMSSKDIVGHESFWLTDPCNSDGFYGVRAEDGSTDFYWHSNKIVNIRPLITVVK